MGTIIIQCPHCGNTESVDKQHNKRTVTCPQCGQSFTAVRALSAWKQYEGQLIDGKYLLRELIGAGSFGGVFRAEQMEVGKIGQSYALKFIPSDPLLPRERQAEELIASIKLEHPAILRGVDAGICNLTGMALLYLVMELAEETLEDRLGRGPLTPREAREVAELVGSALVYLHQEPRRLVHCDLKPANIMRVGTVWKLSDFGGLHAMKRTKPDDQPFGTERYMPPEAFDGVISPASDMWSFGITLAEALTGRHPFASDRHLLFAITQTEPRLPKDLPYPFKEVIRGCLIKNYKQRWSAQHVLSVMKQRSHSIRATLSACRWSLKMALKRLGN